MVYQNNLNNEISYLTRPNFLVVNAQYINRILLGKKKSKNVVQFDTSSKVL
jgi:hypothetical protein